MRNVRFQPFLLALLLGLSAFGMGCRQSEEPDSDRVAIEQDEQDRVTEPEIVGEDPELQPEQRIVVVEPETGEDAAARQDLDERERRLAERNAELDARERRLREQDAAERQARLREREREQQAREPERQAREPEPEPERQARVPKPVPPKAPPARTPRVEREEPIPEEPVETEEVAESRRPNATDTRDDEAEREAAELERERQAREREARERQAREREEREAEERARRNREREEEEREREREREAQLPAPLVVNVPAGTVMEVELLEGLSSQTSEPGDIFRARVASDVASDGAVGIPAGSEIVGVVTEAVPLGKVGGRARLGLKFTDLVLPNGKAVPIEASLVQQGASETRKDAATIGGAAAGGAILGRVLSKKDRSRGAVIGAIIGAAAGAVLASRNGEEVVIPEGTRVDLKLDDELELWARQAGAVGRKR